MTTDTQARPVKTVTSFERSWIERNELSWKARTHAIVENARNKGWNLRMEMVGDTYHFIAWDPTQTDGRLEL